MKLHFASIAAVALFLAGTATGQTPPAEMYFSPDGHMLYTGGAASTGLYDESLIKVISLTFPQANYWNQLTANYQSKTDLLANMTIDGVGYDSVGVRFKGQTSYMNVQNSQKKSFNITTDFLRPKQKIMGYQTLNLNNCFEDRSFMREVFYLHQIRRHIPAAKASYVQLYINGQSWGLYPNVQQLNKDYLKEWYMTNDGTNWRADVPPGTGGGGPGGGGGGWGDGTAALNYLGADTADYQQYYTLKSTDKDNPWNDLVTVCDKLNNTAGNSLATTMPAYLDLDRTLWYLASEIAFTDDDGYVYKGKMDYYLYWEKETGRMVPQEFDGNSAMETSFATSWSPFYNANKVNYPLLNKLLAVPEIRQRYLAHMRTIIKDELDTAATNALFDNYKVMIDSLVQADPKKLYNYSNFTTEVTTLKNFINTRRNYLLSNSEVAEAAPVITAASHWFNNVEWAQPQAGTPVPITATVASANGIDHVNLYYATGWVGNFTKTQMYDDGQHNDGAPADGVYGGNIPAYGPGEYVRYYIEAAAANTAKSVSYLPAGAEHNVFIYLTRPQMAEDSSVVINEVMASNTATQADEAGEFDDWIELYNRSNNAIDLSGFLLTDNEENIDKWKIPAGTTLQPGAYLIIWADEDSSQGMYHANFKLSASGEKLMLLNAQQQQVDQVNFGTQTTDQGFARIPNGTGAFTIKAPTFMANNEGGATGLQEVQQNAMSLYPNPANNSVYIITTGGSAADIEVVNALGQQVVKLPFNTAVSIFTTQLAPGTYFVKCGTMVKKLMVQH